LLFGWPVNANGFFFLRKLDLPAGSFDEIENYFRRKLRHNLRERRCNGCRLEFDGGLALSVALGFWQVGGLVCARADFVLRSSFEPSIRRETD